VQSQQQQQQQQQQAAETPQSNNPSQLQPPRQQASASQQPQHYEQSRTQQIGVDAVRLPVQGTPFSFSFHREADVEQRRVAMQQAELVAQLDNTEIASDESDTPPSSVNDFLLDAKYGAADASFEDEAVFDSSDDSGIDPSDGDWNA
jgi:hypothetical protein